MMSFATQEEKIFTIKLPQSKISYMWDNMDKTKKYLAASNLPHQDVVRMVGAIDSIQKMLAPQINEQAQQR